MTLHLPECLPPEAVDEWIDSTVQFIIDRWQVEGEEWSSHTAWPVGDDIEGAPTASNYMRELFSLIEDDLLYSSYVFDEEGYVTNWMENIRPQCIFSTKDGITNEEYADQWVGRVVHE